jgi:hypothetical protein
VENAVSVGDGVRVFCCWVRFMVCPRSASAWEERRGGKDEDRPVESQNVATGPCPRKSVFTLGLPIEVTRIPYARLDTVVSFMGFGPPLYLP